MNTYLVKVKSKSDLENLKRITKSFNGVIKHEEPTEWKVMVDLPDWTNSKSISEADWQCEIEIDDLG